MPPSFPTSSMISLTRCKASKPPNGLRTFTTTTRLSSIGPESPKFITIPRPPQPYAIRPKDIKGILPPPRNLFPSRSRDKTTDEYFARTTPEPSKPHDAPNDYVAWKRRMATSRRENLREGLLDLNKRKIKQQIAMATTSQAKMRRREALLHAPMRKDERLTNPTIKEATRRLQSGPVPDPGREERVAAGAARVLAKATAKEEARRNALHTLYMNAREFITTEEQLNEEIERVFAKDAFGPDSEGRMNAWDEYGAPVTVQDMLSAVNNTQRTAVSFHAGPAHVVGRRIKKIAEELTGGKMD